MSYFDRTATVENNPEAQRTLETMLRNYGEVNRPTDRRYAETSWDKISGDPKAERTLEGEAVRQLAQFAASGDNSETGYLEPLNRDRQQERRAFYEKALQQLNDGVFGDRLKEKVNSVLRKVSRLKSLRGGQ